MALSQMMADARPPALCLIGPTASGKTALAINLAQRLPFEIISVDSALVYRGMDIGTAKPDLATRQRIPHRLVDILDPSEAYSAGRFRLDAQREIAEIHAKGRIPLLVGGTLLYFRALEQGLAALPSADLAVRAKLTAALAAQGNTILHARLAQIDPTAATKIHPHDTQRIQRALEVHELTGCSLTELCRIPRNESLPFRLCKLIVAPANRQWLHDRIEQRFHAMLEQGFVAEVEGLKARGDLDASKPAMRAVGYRQIWQYLDGELNFTEMIERSIVATRQFAKRQLTWLRAESGAEWLDSADSGVWARVLVLLRENRFFPNGSQYL